MNAIALNPSMIVALFVSFATVSAQDWPQWRGPNRDGHAAEFKAPANWPGMLTQQWDVAVGEGDATPALKDNKLWVFSRQEGREILRCLDAATGKELWQDAYDAQGATGAASRHSGPRSSPVVADGKVITYGVRGTLSCLDAASGKVIWRKDEFPGAWPQFFTSSSPLVADGLCVAQLGGSEAGGIVAYDLETGEAKWKWTREGTAYASPVALTIGGTTLVAALTDQNLVLLGLADGRLLWENAFAPARRAYNAATPLVDEQTVIFTGANRGTTAYRIEKAGDQFAVKEIWTNPDIGVQYNSPVLKNNSVFGLSQGGDLFCLDARDGTTTWTSSTGDRGGFGTVVVAGDVLMLLTPKAELVVFALDREEYKPLATYKVADSETYAYPVVAGNRIYVKDQDSLSLWMLQ